MSSTPTENAPADHPGPLTVPQGMESRGMRYRAYLFDVQGTLLDFFQPVSSAVADHLDAVGACGIDAADVTRAWRANYFERLRDVPQSVDTWRPVQGEYELGFHEVCRQFGLPAAEPATAAAVFVRRPWEYGDPVYAHDVAATDVTQYVHDLHEVE